VKRVQIERKEKVSRGEIAAQHLGDVGKPVVITDAIDQWEAASKWTFEFFRTTYGSDLATAWLGRGGAAAKLTSLSTYIDHLDKPWELPGLWIDKNGNPLSTSPEPGNSPPYLLGWYALRQHPELYNDISPAPYFVCDLVAALSPTIRRVLEWTSEREYSAIYIGPAGSLSALHRDYWNTHGYLAQIQGRKRAILFSPEDSEFLYRGKVDPEVPDFRRFPLFEQATAYECVLEPGDTLLTPANWWHHVRGLESSITVSHNFFSDSNLNDHIVQILRNLPLLVKGLENCPNCREGLHIKWSASDLTSADGSATVWNWSGFEDNQKERPND
jgi:hypothetical protein